MEYAIKSFETKEKCATSLDHLKGKFTVFEHFWIGMLI